MLFFIELATLIAFYVFTNILYEKIYPSKNLNIIFRILYILAVALIMTYIKTLKINILNFSFSFLAVILFNIIFFKPPSKSFLVYDAIIYIIMLIVEMITAFIIALILNVPVERITEKPYSYAATALMNWIIMLALARLFVNINSEKGINNARTQEVMMFFGLIIGEIILLSFLSDILSSSKTGYEIVIILLIFALLDLYLIYLINRISKAYKTEKELELVTQQSMLQLNAYNKLNEKYIASRRVIHDARKHIASLEGLINANKADEAEKYKDLLNNELNKLMPRFECDSSILTVVINNKLEAADNMKVDFRVDAEYTQMDFISNLDITAIFSNLLDNAFEACSELPENKRHVWLSITRRNHFIFIYVENTFARVEQDVKKVMFRSTKKGHQGIGMSNIRNACEKYKGNFNAHTENDMFITEILIPIADSNSIEDIAQKEHLSI